MIKSRYWGEEVIQGERAFTLLEVLLIMVIISILVSVSIPGFSILLIRMRLETDFRELYLDFLNARQLAVTRQMDYGLRFDKENGSYAVFSVLEGEFQTGQLAKGVSYGEITFGGDREMIFKPGGTAEGGHVTLTAAGVSRGYQITVSGVTGRVRYEIRAGEE